MFVVLCTFTNKYFIAIVKDLLHIRILLFLVIFCVIHVSKGKRPWDYMKRIQLYGNLNVKIYIFIPNPCAFIIPILYVTYDIPFIYEDISFKIKGISIKVQFE